MGIVRCFAALFIGFVTIAGLVRQIEGAPVAPQAFDRGGQNDGQSQRGCSSRRLRGAYSVLATGTVVVAPPGSGIPAGPFATVGTLSIDSNGNASLNATRSFNGQIVAEVDLPGTVAVSEDCRGSAEFQGGRTFDIVVLENQNEMHWIQTNPGTW